MITNFKPIACLVAILAIGLLLGPASATASGISVSAQPSDWLIIYNASHKVEYKISATESQELEDPGQLFAIDHAGLVNSDMLDARIFLCDPSGKISDVFGIFKLDSSGDSKKWTGDSPGEDDSGKQFVLGFISDPLGSDSKKLDFDSEKCGKTITCIPEGRGGSPGNATLFLSKDLRDAHWTATFMSDSEVPEPATTGLLFGMGALGLCIWKRRTIA